MAGKRTEPTDLNIEGRRGSPGVPTRLPDNQLRVARPIAGVRARHARPVARGSTTDPWTFNPT